MAKYNSMHVCAPERDPPVLLGHPGSKALCHQHQHHPLAPLQLHDGQHIMCMLHVHAKGSAARTTCMTDLLPLHTWQDLVSNGHAQFQEAVAKGLGNLLWHWP